MFFITTSGIIYKKYGGNDCQIFLWPQFIK